MAAGTPSHGTTGTMVNPALDILSHTVSEFIEQLIVQILDTLLF